MRRLVLIALVTLAGCNAEQTGGELPPVGAEFTAVQMQACQEKGGRFLPLKPGGALVCYTTPKDAGDHCTVETDCESACLARSQTCAPVKPMFGCNEILTSSGLRMTQCLE
jgi:hypothetical protein